VANEEDRSNKFRLQLERQVEHHPQENVGQGEWDAAQDHVQELSLRRGPEADLAGRAGQHEDDGPLPQ